MSALRKLARASCDACGGSGIFLEDDGIIRACACAVDALDALAVAELARAAASAGDPRWGVFNELEVQACDDSPDPINDEGAVALARHLVRGGA